MNETNTNWDDLRLFLAVAREGGLSRAAAVTGKSPPTLGRRMLALERRLGRDLFHRLARGYELTDDGEEFLAKAKELEQAFLPLLSPQDAHRPTLVKVSAGLWVTFLLCDQVTKIARDDALRLRFIAADGMVDIGRREAVIGVRNRRPDGIGLAGRKVGRVEFAAYARDATVTPWARVLGATPSAKWVQEITKASPAIEVTNARNALDLALAGAARVVLPTFIGQRFSALCQIQPTIAELAHDQWLVTHHEDRFLPAVRRVTDRIYTILKQEVGRG